MSKTGDLSNLRKEYLQSGIVREDLKDSPIEQFSLWFSQAMEANIIEPSAMSLATSDDSIGIRTVLLKYFDEKYLKDSIFVIFSTEPIILTCLSSASHGKRIAA